MKQSEYVHTLEVVERLTEKEQNQQWILERTEKFCKDQSIYNAIMESISILDGSNTKFNKEAIPSLLQDALAISFDKNIGHDFFDDADRRYDFYHLKEERVPFGLEMFNKITKGGLPKKTLNVCLAGCVRPDTKVKIRFRRNQMWQEKAVDISSVKTLLDQGYEVEITSPDGWVGVSEFVDKGDWEEYQIDCDGRTVFVNESHLFETTLGWVSAHEMLASANNDIFLHIKTDSGNFIKLSGIRKTGKTVPIVDIQVDHKNHRYYANGLSSHNTNVGKSLFLCDHAAKVLQQGKNVLYITLEMAEERIAERIDCNLMGIDLDELYHMKKTDFSSRMSQIHGKVNGKLIVKEYPTSAAHAGHFKALLDELKVKRNFKPDLVCIDYINICSSQRLRGNSSANSYTIVKSIAEELRGLAVEYDIPILSATQTNRSGWKNTEVEMSDTSESAGLPMTVDWMFAMIRTDELDELGQVLIKQLKSRYNDVNYYKRFVVGVDIRKFTMYDVEQSTKDLSDVGRTDEDSPAFDKSSFGSAMKQRGDFPELDFS
jgi:hypothetical protein